MNGLQIVEKVLDKLEPSTALAALAAGFFALMFYKSCVNAIAALQKENQRLVEEKKILYTKLGLKVENSGLDHYTDKKGGKK